MPRKLPPQKSTPPDSRWWWQLDEEDDTEHLAASLTTYFDDVKRRSATRLLCDLENLRLYGSPSTSPYLGANGYGQASASRRNPYVTSTRVTVSLVQACIDTLTSKLSMEQPRPLFTVSGGDFEAHELAEQLQAFEDGIFYETGTYDVTLRQFVDAGIFGTGFIYVFQTDDRRIGIERAFPYEMFVDDADALYGSPRNLYRCRYMDRGVLKALYPDVEERLIDLAAGLKQEDVQTNTPNNLVRVIEAWHLPSTPGAGDGLHCKTISNAVLDAKEWTRDGFPFSVLRYNQKQIGYFAQGLAEVLAPLQTELNTLLRKIQICMHFLAIPHWLKPSGSNIQFGAFNNQIGSVINYTGTQPELKVWASVPQECFKHVDWLYEKAFELSGVSQLAASSKLPGYGTISGAALRKIDDIGSDRFQYLGKNWRNAHIDLAKLYIETAKEIAEENEGSYPVTVVIRTPTGKATHLQKIDWKDIDLKERDYQIQIQPVSKFATDVPGAMQTGQELVQAGLMDPDVFKDLFNMPDLKADMDLEGAARKLVKKMVGNIITKGEWQAPDPNMDLAYALKFSVLMWNLAMADGVPAKRLEMLRTWSSAVDDLQQEAAQAAQAQQAAQQAAMHPPAPPAQAKPQPPPTSALMPNAPASQPHA